MSLGQGLWRAPAPGHAETRDLLRGLNVRFEGHGVDSSGSYRLLGPLHSDADRLLPGDPDDPTWRAHWIAARIATAASAGDRVDFSLTLPDGSADRFGPGSPRLMGILNLTPDSFSDGGAHLHPQEAADRAEALLAEGVDWLDLGAESTRPGAEPIDEAEEWRRLEPTLERVYGLAPLSVDTSKAQIAARALDAGAWMVNDISGLSDPEMAPLIAERGCPVVLMHIRGTPQTMAKHADYSELVGQVLDELCGCVGKALDSGIAPEQILIDPGVGFAKTQAQNLQMMGRLGALRAAGLPLLLGPSRKSFLTPVLGHRPPTERDAGTAGAAAVCAQQGAAVLRLHTGGSVWESARVGAALLAKP